MIAAGNRGYGAWRDGGLTIHDVSDPPQPKLLSHINWSPPFPGGTHTRAAAAGPQARGRAPTRRMRRNAPKGMFYTFVVDVRAPENPVPISTLPTPTRSRLLRDRALSARTTCTRTGPARFSSEETIFATYNNAGVRVFDIKDAFAPKEIASWVPPTPSEADRSAAQRLARREDRDIYVTTEGLMYVSDWNAGLHVLQYEG